MSRGYGEYCPIAKATEVLGERWTPLIPRMIDRPEPGVCVKHPGLDEDLVVTTDCVTLTDVHRGRIAFAAAIASGRLRIDGPATLARAFPSWGGLSYYAGVRPARTA